MNRGFARLFGIDLGEAEAAPEAYPSLSAFFVRRLRPGTRTWPTVPGVPGSPVDGVLGTFGPLEDGTVLQAKGIRYPVSELLCGDPSAFRSGWFFTIYLSPRHYHRIHAPLGGRLWEARAIPGRLLPVNAPAVRAIPDLFPRNERLVACMHVGDAELALVAVGAYNVGSVEAAFDPDWSGGGARGVTNRPGRRDVDVRSYDPPLPVERGREVMAFHLGSTVVLLLGGDGRLPEPTPELREGMELRLGTPLLEGPIGGGGPSDGRESRPEGGKRLRGDRSSADRGAVHDTR